MCLTIYAVKCGIEFEELEKDAFDFQEQMNKIAPQNPFTEDDINSALEMFQDCYKSFPRDEISKISAIEIKPNRRNGRSQADHLKLARFIRDEVNQNVHWRNGNGRKSVEKVVFEFLEMNPKATAKQFCELTGMSERVFYKYKKQWLEARQTQYEEDSMRFAFASIFDNAVKDANTGIKAPTEPPKLEDYFPK